MGCGRSASKPTSFVPIDLAIEPCPLDEFEAITRPATEPMRTLETCYNKFYLCLQDLESACAADIIKKRSFRDVMLAVCMCYSVSCAGEVHKLDLNVKAEFPYISLQRLRLHQDHMPASTSWDELVNYMKDYPSTLESVEQQLKVPVEKSKSIMPRLLSAMAEAKYSQVEALTVAKLTTSNVNKLNMSLKLLRRLLNDIANFTSEAQAFVRTWAKKEAFVRHVGLRCRNYKVNLPVDIIERYWESSGAISKAKHIPKGA
mmetsp:Transcript_7326/g.13558  ORF Transcript_7326/g.13558 Transcript_7326/m.13558 type:complete len:259 (+) Transcript_7326:1475-2251(+)